MNRLSQLWANLHSSLEERWLTFNAREQKIISVLILVTAIWLIYNLMVGPVLSAKEQAQNRLQVSQHTYQQASERAAKIFELRAAGNQFSKTYSGSLESRINDSAKQFTIKISTLNLQNQVATLRLEPVKFATLTQWLMAMNEEQIITLGLDMIAGERSGYVEVRQLQLKSAG